MPNIGKLEGTSEMCSEKYFVVVVVVVVGIIVITAQRYGNWF